MVGGEDVGDGSVTRGISVGDEGAGSETDEEAICCKTDGEGDAGGGKGGDDGKCVDDFAVDLGAGVVLLALPVSVRTYL